MDPELAALEEKGERSNRIRSGLYWISATVATIVFLLFFYTMMMVPGLDTSSKLWMLAIEIALLSVPFGLRIWEFRTTEITFVGGFRGGMGLLLILELAWCLIAIFELAFRK